MGHTGELGVNPPTPGQFETWALGHFAAVGLQINIYCYIYISQIHNDTVQSIVRYISMVLRLF